MDQELIGRRGLLRGAGAAGGLAVTGILVSAAPAAAATAADDDDDDRDDRNDRLRGSWLVTVVGEDGAQTLSVGSFAAGKVAIVHDIRPAGPPFTGTWRSSKGKEFRATLWSGFPGDEGPGSAGPTGRLSLEGERENGMISGTYTFTLFDPTGAEAGSFAGTFSGERIEA